MGREMASGSQKNRVAYFDVLNIVATLSVVFLHCNGLVHTYSDTWAWKQALAVEVLCYWAVPVFFMLSGATLIDYHEKYSTKDFFVRRFTRTVIPFLIWLCINIVVKGIDPFEFGIKGFVEKLLISSYENIYWFFIPLFAAYLCMPVFAYLSKNKKILWYIAIMGFVFNSFLPAIFREFGMNWNTNWTFSITANFLGYCIIGYLLSKTELSKKYRIAIYILGVIGCVIRYAGTVLFSMRDGAINKTFFYYTDYYAYFLAVAVFVFFKYSNILKRLAESKLWRKVVPTIASCSFGVYLTHMIVYRFIANFVPTATWEWRLLMPFVIYGICVAGTYILKKIPVLKYIVP